METAVDFSDEEGTLALTREGTKRLTMAVALESPSVALQVRQGISLVDMTLHELLLWMHEQGWAGKPLPKKKAERQRLVHVLGGAKEYYFNTASLPHRLYLIALIRSENLKREVPHWTPAPAKTYADILAGEGQEEEARAGNLQVQLEFEENEAVEAERVDEAALFAAEDLSCLARCTPPPPQHTTPHIQRHPARMRDAKFSHLTYEWASLSSFPFLKRARATTG